MNPIHKRRPKGTIVSPGRTGRRSLKLSSIKVRRALASDKEPILEICKDIWNGQDYVPQVWDEWLNDNRGCLVVATVGGTQVGVAHAYLQTRDVAWLEGVRVHEKYRGLGIAGELNSVLTRWAFERGARVAHLCTGSSNIASRRHLAKTGFELLQSFQRLDSTKALRNRLSDFANPKRPVRGLWRWLSSSPEFADSRAMYSDGWTFYPFTARQFGSWFARRRVLLSRHRPPSSCAVCLNDDGTLTVGFVMGEPDDMIGLGRMLRYLLFRGKYRKVRVLLPAKSRLVRALERAGFERTAKILVYERLLR